jgi:hypothetical protein
MAYNKFRVIPEFGAVFGLLPFPAPASSTACSESIAGNLKRQIMKPPQIPPRKTLPLHREKAVIVEHRLFPQRIAAQAESLFP